MIDIKHLDFPFSSLKFIHIVPTIQRNFAIKNKNITHYIYQSFENVFGINRAKQLFYD